MVQVGVVARHTSSAVGYVSSAAAAAVIITLLVISILALKGKISSSTSGYVIAGLAGGLGLCGMSALLFFLPKRIQKSRLPPENRKPGTMGPKGVACTFVFGVAVTLAVVITLVVMGILVGQGKLSAAILAKTTLGIEGMIGLTLLGGGCCLVTGICMVGLANLIPDPNEEPIKAETES